jgi:ATP synthase protein I
MTPTDPQRGASASTADVQPGSQSAPGRQASRGDIWNELDQSSIMSVELIAAILTWGGVGWLADRWLGTDPWLFGLGVMIGFAAGLYLVWYRSGKDQEFPNGAGRSRAAQSNTEDR